ncbi:bifunctional riboflavin kinase/FMN phosphatase [Tanacetum coccineum]
MAMSIGWNPFFNNTEKTIEPWLLHKFDEDFYGEELHLVVVVGYIRPEFDTSCMVNNSVMRWQWLKVEDTDGNVVSIDGWDDLKKRSSKVWNVKACDKDPFFLYSSDSRVRACPFLTVFL